MRLDLVVSSAPSAASATSHDCTPPLPPVGTGSATSPIARRAASRPAAEVIDVFLRGAPQADGARPSRAGVEAFALRDLALALIDLAGEAGPKRPKSTVRHVDEPWELCVERFGATACLSVYRAGAEPMVAMLDQRMAFDDLVAATRDAIDAAELRLVGSAQSIARVELASVAAQLVALPPAGPPSRDEVPELESVIVEPERDSPLTFAAEFAIRACAPVAASESVERADLHALLFRGRVRAEIRGRTVDLGEAHPALVCERLVELARRAFDAWERGLPFQARSEAAGILIGMRVSTEGELALSLGGARTDAPRTFHTFPALGVADVLEAALYFGRSLVRAILRRDRSQSSNLRLSALRRALRDSTETLRAASLSDSKVNPSPEPYRAFAAALAEARPQAGASGSTAAARLRYAPLWRTIVPGLDLRATYLCGDRVIVGAATEMWALDRQTGRVLWRSDVPRGTSVVTPGGVARLAPDGTFAVYDFGSGERTLRARLAPRAGAPVAGAVVHLPGLPRLVVVTEGEHHLVAVDLTTGEPRWRWSWGAHRGTARRAPRMKRAGRLIYFTCGDGALTALDVMTGAVVWRLRDRLRFRTPPTVARDALFVASGGAHGVAKLYCVDPYSGNVRWAAALAEPNAPCTIEGAPLVANGAVAVVVRQKSGVTLAIFRQEDGTPVGDRDDRRRAAPIVAPVGTSWLGVDDAFIGNAPTGELVSVDARSGELRWRHVLGPRPLEADIPRRLEPVLRGGALFVPCSLVSTSGSAAGTARDGAPRDERAAAGVCVVRPADGALLGSIAPTETIPDLLRVDERCHVYIAEESGHLATFAALPRLSLVSN